MWFLYRLNGGQVIGATVNSDGFGYIDSRFFGVCVDPLTPDGKDLAVPKIFDSGANSVRNATSAEIANFLVAEQADEVILARYNAQAFADEQPVSRKVIRAIVQIMVDEINTLRAAIRQAHPAQASNLPDRTLEQAKTAMLNIINGGTVD
jgi:hypothetical protein